MGRFLDEFKNALRDQAVGAFKYGASTSYRHNKAAMDAAKAERLAREAPTGHRGGFEEAQHGSINGHPVTFAFGFGSKEGHTLIADGHISDERFFKQSANHDHYGPGDGPRNNGTLRGKYTGPGA
jgi:hypothetical protein